MSKVKLLLINKLLRADLVGDRELLSYTREHDKMLKLATLATRRDVIKDLLTLDVSVQLTRTEIDKIILEINREETFNSRVFDTRHLTALLGNTPKPRPDSKLKDMGAIAKMFLSGSSKRAVAKEYGVAETTAADWKTKLGIPDIKFDPNPEIIRMRREGIPNTHIAETLGLSLSAVARRVRKLKLPRN